MENELISVEVVYAKKARQALISVQLEKGLNAEQAVVQSGILEQFPEIDLDKNGLGVFGQCCKKDRILQNGDRVEIYRSLLQDPMEARRKRAGRI